MKRIYKYIFFASLAGLLASCNDFLDKSPEARKGQIETIEQLEGLIASGNWKGENQFDNNRAMMFSGDCFEITPEYYSGGLRELGTSDEVIQYATWNMEYLQDANQMLSKWYNEYQAIYRANLILENVDKVVGSDERKEAVRIKAHLVRAYSYLELVEYYCMPYGESTLDELGLPLKRTTNYEEDITRRASLEATYDFIESDILEAVKLKEPLFVGGQRKSWKETGATANALAARFYMATHNYEQALKYAGDALSFGDDISDYNTDIWQIPGIFAPSLNIRDNISVIQDIAYYERAYYNRLAAYLFEMVWMIPSPDFLDLFDRENAYDLRYKYFYWHNGQNLYLFAMFKNPFPVEIPIWMGTDIYICSTPNVAEMMLIRAECLARSNKVSEAMSELNNFRKYRFDTNTPSDVLNLMAGDQATAVRLVLEERRREFPFTMRWRDIRRLNFNDDPSDNVTVTRTFYPVSRYAVDDLATPVTYTLTPSSRNFAVAIPSGEIASSNGTIVQNPY